MNLAQKAPRPAARSAAPFWRALCFLLGAVAALSLLCWAIRLHSTVRQGDMMLTTGFEDASIYNVWKVRHGAPLYEWPDRGNYAPTFYNFLFYRVYALVLDGLGVPNDARGMLAGRLLASGFGLFGALGQWRLSLQLLRRWPVAMASPRSGPERTFLLVLAGICWFSTNTAAWTPLTLRPDMAGLAFMIWGVVAWMAAWEFHRAGRQTFRAFLPALAAGACFFAAWGFKQPLVWAFAGLMLHALLSPPSWRWRALGWVGVPVGVAIVLCIGGFGPEYRQNTLVVIAAYQYFWRVGAPLLVQTAVAWFPVWAFALPPVLGVLRRWRAEGREAAMAQGTAPVAFAVLASTAFNVFAAFKEGSSGNILLESYFLAASLAGVHLVQLARARSDRPIPWFRLQRGIALAGWTGFLVLPMVQLVFYGQGRAFATVAGVHPGGLRKLNARDEALRRDFARWMEGLPKPLFTRDGLFAQPWHATAQRYPSFIIDWQATGFMRQRGLMRADAGVPDFIRAGHFRCLLLDASDAEMFPLALAAGYQERPLPERFANLPNEYGQYAKDLRWLEKPTP